MPAFMLFLRHFQPLLSPKSVDALLIHLPTRTSQQRLDTSITVSWMLLHQGQHFTHQLLLFLICQRLIPLTRSRLTKRPARPTFGHVQLLLYVCNRRSTADRARTSRPSKVSPERLFEDGLIQLRFGQQMLQPDTMSAVCSPLPRASTAWPPRTSFLHTVYASDGMSAH